LRDPNIHSKNVLKRVVSKLKANSKILRVDSASHRVTCQWSIGDGMQCISVTAAATVIVTCDISCKLLEFTADGKPVRTINLHSDMVDPWHAVMLASGEFLICHGLNEKTVRRVCRVYGTDKSPPTMTYSGGDSDDLSMPVQIAFSSHKDLALVVDVWNRRIVVLDTSLKLVGNILLQNYGCGVELFPVSVCLDEKRGRLYVAVTHITDGTETQGEVKVFEIDQ
jgi:hypothetical protein